MSICVFDLDGTIVRKVKFNQWVLKKCAANKFIRYIMGIYLFHLKPRMKPCEYNIDCHIITNRPYYFSFCTYEWLEKHEIKFNSITFSDYHTSSLEAYSYDKENALINIQKKYGKEIVFYEDNPEIRKRINIKNCEILPPEFALNNGHAHLP